GRALGWDEAACRARPCAGVRSSRAADGRAVRLAGRADARNHAGGADLHLGAHGQDDLLRHPRHRRGRVPRRPRARAERAAGEPALIRLGHGFAAEEQVWLMAARPDLTPGQGTKYRLKLIPFQGNPERFQAYLAGELEGGTAPGLAVIFARAQGVDIKIVAGI